MGHRVPYADRTRALYARQEPYRWIVHDPEREPPPWTPIRRPLEELRIALIGSGGVHLLNDQIARRGRALGVPTPTHDAVVNLVGAFDWRAARR